MSKDHRRATPERWARALERAARNGLQCHNHEDDPTMWFVSSATTPGAAYVVTAAPGRAPTCACAAAMVHSFAYCQHRALVLDRLGRLPRQSCRIQHARVSR